MDLSQVILIAVIWVVLDLRREYFRERDWMSAGLYMLSAMLLILLLIHHLAPHCTALAALVNFVLNELSQRASFELYILKSIMTNWLEKFSGILG